MLNLVNRMPVESALALSAKKSVRTSLGGRVLPERFNDKRYIKNLGIFSTAAGAYQILYRYWVVYKKQLGLHDFGPASQDQIALQLLKECHCLADIDVGDVSTAVMKCSSRWASLPGNLDGQHKTKMGELLAWYTEAFTQMA